MKQILKGLLTILLLVGFSIQAGSCSQCCSCNQECNQCCLDTCDGYPFLLPRSQGRNGVRDLVGWQELINKYGMDCHSYGDFAVTFEYDRSMKPEKILQFYFGNQLATCNGLLIQGSSISPRHNKAWVADYFGLPTDYQSLVRFEPRIENFTVDLHLYLGLDRLRKGTYLRIEAPLTRTKWDLNMTECIKNKGTADFGAGYMTTTTLKRENLPAHFIDAMLGQTTLGDMQDPIKYGRFPICSLKRTRIADIRTSLGWNMWQEEDHHFGAFVQLVAPTGTRPSACYLFEPIVGNGRHWELGGGITSSYIFWRSCECEDNYLGVWFDATITHLFNSCQRRSFDFCGKPNSRYMLLTQMGPVNTSIEDGILVNGANEPVLYQYQQKLIPAINWSTLNVDVKIDVQADIVLKFGYVKNNWNVDLGYNFWARTGEKFTYCKPCGIEQAYSLKGDVDLYGEIYLQNNGATPYGPYPLGNSKNRATITCANTLLDNPEDAKYNIDLEGEIFAPLSKIGSEGTIDLQVSDPALIVSKNDLNMSKSPSAITHKLFLNFNHTWCSEERWYPFLGIGGAIEWDHGSDCCGSCGCSSSSCCVDSCDYASTNAMSGCRNAHCHDKKTKRGGVSQWGIWLKGGVYFE